MPAGTPVSNDLFSQALQQALQASNMSALQVSLRKLCRKTWRFSILCAAALKLFTQRLSGAEVKRISALDAGDFGRRSD